MNLRTALAIFGGVAWTGLCVWGTWAVADTNTKTTTPDTVRVDREMEQEDLVPGTMPDQVTAYKDPDTADTQEKCFQIPTWLTDANQSGREAGSSRTARSTESVDGKSPESDSGKAPGLAETILHEPSVGPSFATTPLTNGRPALSVTSRRVKLQGFLPNGAGRTWTYDIPQDRNRISLYGRATTLPGTPAVTSGVRYSRQWHFGRLDLTAAPFAGVGVTNEGRGFAGGLELSIGLKW